MPLVNIVPNMILHQKIHAPTVVNFFGESKGLPAPCAGISYKHTSKETLVWFVNNLCVILWYRDQQRILLIFFCIYASIIGSNKHQIVYQIFLSPCEKASFKEILLLQSDSKLKKCNSVFRSGVKRRRAKGAVLFCS